ncbi:glycosyltransferase [uncultured Methylobacterium sp.]|uniref:glycosyltransferase n=1 Tax=uncultured Methylobacterium sp. TaxID=157278 RepID=UPI0035CAD3E4
MGDDAPTGRPAILVVAPMPAAPASAGNRRRLALTCQALQRAGFALDFAYFAHEDQIYRRFGQRPPTDFAAMAAAFRRTFLIEADETIPLKSRSGPFGIDDWASAALDRFVAWYAEAHPGTVAVLVNYVFLSRCLERVPAGILKLIDTHDRFTDRHLQYRPFRAEPNFFYTDRAGEAAGLARADVVLAIQAEEAAHFADLTDRRVLLLPPAFPVHAPFAAPAGIARIGFVGHGNDPNLFSISKFAHAWTMGWTPDRPELLIAGEICNALGGLSLPGVRLLGYVEDLRGFYAQTDVIVAPMLMGSGLKMKVAEALSHGVPVVGTGIGFEGFGAEAPAHRCAGVEAVKATILALHRDEAGLAALTRACAALLDRYNDHARRSEAELAALIGAAARGKAEARGKPDEGAPVAAPSPSTDAEEAGLACARALDSPVLDDPERGRLVATERLSEDAARALRYAPERRRWFAAPAVAAGRSLGPVRVAFSPEWVRDRRLPGAAREAAILAFRDAVADWTTDGRRVGAGGAGFDLALRVPSHFLTGPRSVAAFLVEAAGGRAHELTLDGLAPLHGAPGLAFDAARPDLTPVPALASFRHAGPGPLPAEGTVLVLSDDLIGRVRIVADRPSAESVGLS